MELVGGRVTDGKRGRLRRDCAQNESQNRKDEGVHGTVGWFRKPSRNWLVARAVGQIAGTQIGRRECRLRPDAAGSWTSAGRTCRDLACAQVFVRGHLAVVVFRGGNDFLGRIVVCARIDVRKMPVLAQELSLEVVLAIEP